MDLSTVEKLRDDSSNYFEWKKTISALLRSKGILGACCPTDSLSASMMYAEWVAADTTQKLAKLQLKRFTAESEAVWMINQTISNSHQIDIEGMDHAAKVWVRLRPKLTHTDGDRLMKKIISVNITQFATPLQMISEYQTLQAQMESVPGGEDIWSESQTVRLAVHQFTGERWISFRESLYEEKAITVKGEATSGWRITNKQIQNSTVTDSVAVAQTPNQGMSDEKGKENDSQSTDTQTKLETVSLQPATDQRLITREDYSTEDEVTEFIMHISVL